MCYRPVWVAACLNGALMLFAAWMIANKQVALERLSFLLFTGSIAFLGGVLLVIIGYRLAMRIDKRYDPTDPNEPKIKFLRRYPQCAEVHQKTAGSEGL